MIESGIYCERFGQRPAIAWLTGLPGSGKSSIANVAQQMLELEGRYCAILDGDNLRQGLNADLNFSAADRSECVRRAAEAARLMADEGLIVIVSMISPFCEDRARARLIALNHSFLEIYINTPINVCQERDPKGLYKLARIGRIVNFTGVSSPYEVPVNPDIIVSTDNVTVANSAKSVVNRLLCLTKLTK